MAGAAAQVTAAPMPTLSQSLADLKQWLQDHCSSSTRVFCPAPPAAADTQLQQLRRATAAVQQQPQLSAEDSDACTAAAVSCMELLTAALLQPPEALYSGLSGTPCLPETGLELAGEQQQLVVTAQLQLLSQLVLLLAEQLEAPAGPTETHSTARTGTADEQDRARNRPSYFQGIVEIEELPDDGADASSSNKAPDAQQQLQTRLQQQVLQLLLVCALYAADSSSCSSSVATAASSTGDDGCGDAADAAAGSQRRTGCRRSQLPGSNNDSSSTGGIQSFCDSIVQQGLQLLTPWSGSDCQQQAQQLAQQVVGALQNSHTGSLSHADGSSRQHHAARHEPTGGQQQQHRQELRQLGTASASAAGCSPGDADESQKRWQQQEQEEQQVWCTVLPLLLDKLRDALLAQHRHKKLQDKLEIVPYTGPSTFQRCLAARQLAWLAQQLHGPALTEPQTLGLLLPLVLAVADDPSPCMRQYGHSTLGWVGLKAAAGGLQWQAALLREEARRLVVGCEESCWGTALPAATSLIMALEGDDQRSSVYHSLLLELLQEAERTAHKPQPRLVFMACVARLVPRLRLYAVRHLAALMPLLLEWVHAFDAQSSVVALQLLGVLAEYAWPRMGVIQQHVHEVLAQELVEQGMRAGSGEAAGVSKEVEGGAVCESTRQQAAQQLLAALRGVEL